MEIKISALKFSANEPQIDFITKKVERLERFCYEKDSVVEVVLTLEQASKKVQVKLEGCVIERSSDTFENAVTAAVDAMKEKLVREKEKHTW